MACLSYDEDVLIRASCLLAFMVAAISPSTENSDRYVIECSFGSLDELPVIIWMD